MLSIVSDSSASVVVGSSVSSVFSSDAMVSSMPLRIFSIGGDTRSG